MSLDILAAFGALLAPLGALAGVVYAMLNKRIADLERINEELTSLILTHAGESKETREELARVLRGDVKR